MRAKPTTQTEGREDLPIGETFTAAWVGFSHHWRGPEGNKHDAGRILIVTKDEDKYGQYDSLDGNRFRCPARYVVLSSDQSGIQYAGYRKDLWTKLGNILIDVLGQAWNVDYREDPKFWSTTIRILKAGGFELKHKVISSWMQRADEYLEKLYASSPWLFLPAPSEGAMQEVGIEGNPLPGYTRELLLAAIEAQVVERLPIVRFTTVEGKDGGCYIAYDSLSPGDPMSESSYRALMVENEDIKKAIERETAARREGRLEPIQQSTPGMPGVELRDDDLQIVTDALEGEAQRQAKSTLRAHLNQMVAVCEKKVEGFKGRVWARIVDSARASGMEGKPGLNLESLPLSEAHAVWLWTVGETTTAMEKAYPEAEGGFPPGLRLSLDAQTVLREGGIDVAKDMPELCVQSEPQAAPEGAL
jgi:hypothetical protein